MGALFDRPVVLIVLVILVILLFGAKRLPDLSRSVGRSLRIFKAETEGLRGDHSDNSDAEGTTPVAPPAAVTASPIAPVPDPVVTPLTANARYLVDPVTGERVLATPVPQPQQPQG